MGQVCRLTDFLDSVSVSAHVCEVYFSEEFV